MSPAERSRPAHKEVTFQVPEPHPADRYQAAYKEVSFQDSEASYTLGSSSSWNDEVNRHVVQNEARCSEERLPSKTSQGQEMQRPKTAFGRARSFRKVAPYSSGKVLKRAFVVNFRRLMDLQKVLAIIHELIKSTAIAALTLVRAENVTQLCYSVGFVAVLLCLYGFHFGHYDNLDISDYRHLAELLEDDSCEWGGERIVNPNRFLKALKLSKGGRRRRAIYTIVLFVFLCITMWCILFGHWCFGLTFGATYMSWLDDEFYATLLLVGTVMLMFHISFEWIYWRETQCTLPPHGEGEDVWDPRKHGVPRCYRWFGLPSMWFTCTEACDALRLWVAQAKALSDSAARCPKIFPEEMAIFALDGDGCSHLRNALLHAKLYSTGKKAFLMACGDGQLRPVESDDEPEELGMNLVFYDNQSLEYSLPEEDYHEGQVHLLRHASSLGTYLLPRQKSSGGPGEPPPPKTRSPARDQV